MVKLCIDDLDEFKNKIKYKTVYCFGAGRYLDEVLIRFVASINNKIVGVVDNNSAIWRSERFVCGKKFFVISPEELCNSVKKDDLVILITNYANSYEIIEQLDGYADLNDVMVYVAQFFFLDKETKSNFIFTEKKTKEIIPRIIHYCWFGKGSIPKEYEEYMSSWGKYCPDYEIKRWDENNYDIKKNRYAYEAYKNKAWAFVSDVARLDILYNYGGVYLDCDVELLKPLDPFLKDNFFCGFQTESEINLGLGFGAVKGHPYLKRLLELYDSLRFVDEDNNLNMTPCPVYQTKVMKEFGIIPKNSYQNKNGISVYPREVFSPRSLVWGTTEITESTFSIHHFGATWFSDEKKKNRKENDEKKIKILNRYKMQEEEER